MVKICSNEKTMFKVAAQDLVIIQSKYCSKLPQIPNTKSEAIFYLFFNHNQVEILNIFNEGKV